MNKFTKLLLGLIVPVWIFFFLLDVGSFIFFNPQPSVNRAWETALVPDVKSLPNRESMILTPFKPMFTFKNRIKTEDLIDRFNFQPLSEELTFQDFEVDEYGVSLSSLSLRTT